MKYPKLVRKQDCKTPIKIKIFSNDLGEDGEQVFLANIETFCNYQSTSSRRYTEQHQYIDINAIALFHEDIFENLLEITNGEVEVFGNKMVIHKCIKARNPDGTVNFVRLELV